MGFNKLLLNANGLNTEKGANQIKVALQNLFGNDLSSKTVYIVSVPEYEVDDRILKNCIMTLGLK